MVLTYQEAVEAAKVRAKTTREFWAGSHFDVPHNAVDQFTDGIIAAALSAVGYIDLLTSVELLRGSADAWWTEYDVARAEAENLRITVREDKRVMDRDAVEIERLTRIVNGYDRTPAERRAADATAERDAARQTIRNMDAANVAVCEAVGVWEANLGVVASILALGAERDALAATLARVKVEGDRWANSKNYTVQFAGGLIREALRPREVDDE